MSLPPVSLRPLTISDRRSVWEWRNDPVTAELFEVDDGVSCEDFYRWYDQSLNREDVLLAIGHIQSVRIGLVWFRRIDDGVWELRIHFKPAFSGRGLAPSLVREAIIHLTNGRQVHEVCAVVPNVNPSSVYAFSESGFEITDQGTQALCQLTLG